MNKEEKELRKKIAEVLLRARKIVSAHKAEYRGVYTMNKGGGTTTSNTSSSVPPEVLAEYQNVTGQANQVASAPLNQYGGQIVAGTTPNEQAAYNTISNMQGITAPYTGQAQNLIGQATQTINPNTVTPQQIQNYESPYTQSVLNTTMAAQNNQDAQQQEQLQGNAISSGAWGGDRAGVAQGILGGQQALANNATNAGIVNQGYAQALQEANTQQQAGLGAQEASQYLQSSGALAENQLGQTAQAEGLTGANALYGVGQAQQQQAQSELNVPYEQFLQQQAYPFQTTGWLANIAEGIGSQQGGTSTSSTTQPSQGLFGLKRGGIVPRRLASGGWGVGTNSSTVGTIAPTGTKGNEFGNSPIFEYGNNDTGWTNTPPISASSASSSAGIVPAGNGQFTAQVAPTYAQFAASPAAQSGTPYTGGIVPGMNAANMADLKAIYGFRRGGIVPHRDAGGVTPLAQGVGQNSNPFQQNVNSNYSQMNVQQLQQLAQRIPPGSMQGQAIQAALRQKQFMPNVGGMKRGGIVPQHFDGGGSAVTPESGSSADFEIARQPWGQLTIPDTASAVATDDNGMGYVLNRAQNDSNDYYTRDLNASNGTDTASPPSGGIVPPPPTPHTNAPDHPSDASGYLPEMPHTHEANPWLSVAAGVLGTLAGRSRNPLVDIGQGGLIGINNYAQQVKTADEQNYQEGNFHQNAQKLMDETKLNQDKFKEDQLHNSAMEAVAQQNADTNERFRKDQAKDRLKPQLIKDVMGNDIGWSTPGSSKIIPLTGLPDYMSPTGGVNGTSPSSTQPSNTYGPVAPAIGSGSIGKRLGDKLTELPTTPDVIDAKLAKYPPQVVTHAEMLAAGEEAWPTGFVAAKSPIYAMASTLAREINPNITAAAYPTYLDMDKGPSSNVIRSLNTAIPHLDTLGKLADALDNGDTKTVNSIGNAIKTQFGLSAAPTNFDAAKQIVSNEVIKAVIGSGGTGQDREEAQNEVNKANSPALLRGVIKTYQSLMSGQMHSMEEKYQAGTGRKDFQSLHLTPQTRAVLEPSSGDTSSAASAGNIIQYDGSGNRI